MAKTQTGEVQNATLFIATIPVYVVLFILELTFLCHFLMKTKNSKMVKVFKQFAIVLLVIILITLFVELWSIVFDFSFKLPKRTGYCFIQMYIRILSFILLEAIMFLFWIVRINQIFRSSFLALPTKFVHSIYIIIPFLVLVSMILLAINMDTKYYLVNKSFNASIEYGHGCIVEMYHGGSITVKTVLIIGQVLAFSLNIFYGLLFYRKLHQFQRVCATAIKASARAENGKPNAVDILMQKHTLLAVISAICSIIAYIIFNILVFGATNPTDNIFAFQLGFLFIDIDMFIKSITMLFMFNLYTRRFYQLCLCCIKISAIDFKKCCNYCSEIDAKDFNNTIPVFLKLNKKATVVRLNVEEVDEQKYHFDKKTYSSKDLNNAIGTEFYIVKKIPFKYYCALIKVSISENKKTKSQFDQKVYHFANNGEIIEDKESVFKQISRHKERKQSLWRHRNEVAKYGHFMDSNEKNNANTSAHNFYFWKSECKYPFIVAVKCNAHSNVDNGNRIAQYIVERIEDNIKNVKKIEKIKYESLLEEIINEVKTKKMDRNILFKRCGKPETQELQKNDDNDDEKTPKKSVEINMTNAIKNATKNDKNDKYVSVAAASPVEEKNNYDLDTTNDKLKKKKSRKDTSKKVDKNDDGNDNDKKGLKEQEQDGK